MWAGLDIYIYIYIFEIWLLDSYLDNRYNGNRSKCFKEKGSPRLFVVWYLMEMEILTYLAMSQNW